MNEAKRLPDAYQKDVESNIYKVLQLKNLLYSDLKADLLCINQSRDIYTTTGATLDRYGAMVGEARNGATDEQYRTRILNRIAINRTNPDCNSIISAVAQMLGVEPSTIRMQEGENCTVQMSGMSLDSVDKSGYTAEELKVMIGKILPIGVELTLTSFTGTLFITWHKVFNDGNTGVFNEYPVLYSAWFDGQREFAKGHDVGLSGYGKVPDSFKQALTGTIYKDYKTEGTYQGGTLSVLI